MVSQLYTKSKPMEKQADFFQKVGFSGYFFIICTFDSYW